MQVYTLDTTGVRPATPETTKTARGTCWAFKHGQQGRGRWQWRALLAIRDFPATHPQQRPEPCQHYRPLWLEGTDARGNRHIILLRAEEDDGTRLILWSLSPGYRGGASYDIQGRARLIGEGHEAQGDAGRMGGAPCPVVLVEGPCRLSWHRTGRLYGQEADWVAVFDGQSWLVSPQGACALEEAAFAESD